MEAGALINIDDCSSLVLRERSNTNTEPQINTNVLRSTRLEKMIYRELREQFKTGLDEIEKVLLSWRPFLS